LNVRRALREFPLIETLTCLSASDRLVNNGSSQVAESQGTTTIRRGSRPHVTLS
jgi:hypothetical protein